MKRRCNVRRPTPISSASTAADDGSAGQRMQPAQQSCRIRQTQLRQQRQQTRIGTTATRGKIAILAPAVQRRTPRLRRQLGKSDAVVSQQRKRRTQQRKQSAGRKADAEQILPTAGLTPRWRGSSCRPSACAAMHRKIADQIGTAIRKNALRRRRAVDRAVDAPIGGNQPVQGRRRWGFPISHARILPWARRVLAGISCGGLHFTDHCRRNRHVRPRRQPDQGHPARAGRQLRHLRGQAVRRLRHRLRRDDGRGRALAGRLRQPGPAAARHPPGQAAAVRRVPAGLGPRAVLLVVPGGDPAVQRGRHVLDLRGHAQTHQSRAAEVAVAGAGRAGVRHRRRRHLDARLHAGGEQGPRRAEPVDMVPRNPLQRTAGDLRRRPGRADRPVPGCAGRRRHHAHRQPDVRRRRHHRHRRAADRGGRAGGDRGEGAADRPGRGAAPPR